MSLPVAQLGEMLCAFLRIAQGVKPDDWSCINTLFGKVLAEFCQQVDIGDRMTLADAVRDLMERFEGDDARILAETAALTGRKKPFPSDQDARTNRAILRILGRINGQLDLFPIPQLGESHALALDLAETFEKTWRSGAYQERHAAHEGREPAGKCPPWLESVPKTYRSFLQIVADAAVGDCFNFPGRVKSDKQKHDHVKTLNRYIPKGFPWALGKKDRVMMKVLRR